MCALLAHRFEGRCPAKAGASVARSFDGVVCNPAEPHRLVADDGLHNKQIAEKLRA